MPEQALDYLDQVKPMRSSLLTDRLVRDATRELAEAGLLVSKKQAGKVGRPGQEYEASQYLLICSLSQEGVRLLIRKCPASL